MPKEGPTMDEWRERSRDVRFSLKRQLKGITKEEVSLKQEIINYAKSGHPDLAKMLCQALLLAQKSKDKLTTNLARLDDIDLKMKQQAAFQKLSEGIKISTDVARTINKVCMDEGEFAGVLKDFQEQLMRSDIIMDAIDDSDLVPEVSEADAEVDAMLAQLVPGMALDSSPTGNRDAYGTAARQAIPQ